MFTFLKKEPDMQGIAAGQKATGRIWTRQNLYGIWLRCVTSGGVELTRAQILNDISDIIVRINGKTVIDCDADFLLDLQKYYGDSQVAGNIDGSIYIPFARRHLPSFEERAVYAIGAKGVNDISIEAKIDAVAQLSKIEVWGEFDSAAPREIGKHVQIVRHNRTFAATGIQQITDLPFSDEKLEGYFAKHFRFSSATVEYATVKRNGVELFYQIAPKMMQAFLNMGDRSPQSGYFHLDYCRNNSRFSFLPGQAQSMQLDVKWATAAPSNYVIFAETINNGI